MTVLSCPKKPFEDYSSFDLLRVYCRCETFSASAKFARVSRYAWTQKWYELGLPSPKVSRARTSLCDLPYYEVAIVSDLHWGSIFQQKSVFESFVQECRDRGISTLINCGDSIEGFMPYPYHHESRFLHTTSEYEQYFQEHYPGGFDSSFMVQGNHETSLSRCDWGYNFCREMAIRRRDLCYLDDGKMVGPGGVRFFVEHGSGSCAPPGHSRGKKLRSKVLQLMSEGNCADVYVFGHCHNAAFVPSFMNSVIIGAGCFCAPNDYLVRSYGGADVCGAILRYNVNGDRKPVNVSVNFKFAEDYGGIVERDW